MFGNNATRDLKPMTKIAYAFAAILAGAFVGCADTSVHQSSGSTALHPNGTDVGTSFPGVNQATPATTATASTDSR